MAKWSSEKETSFMQTREQAPAVVSPPGPVVGLVFEQSNLVATLADKIQMAADLEAGIETPVWTDTTTGLMWSRKDNGSDIDWNEAYNYCRSLVLEGHTDWRLPTIGELEGIYDSRIQVPGTYDDGEVVVWHVKGFIQLSGFPWSSSCNDSGDAWTFNFARGTRFSRQLLLRGYNRVLCVRRVEGDKAEEGEVEFELPIDGKDDSG